MVVGMMVCSVTTLQSAIRSKKRSVGQGLDCVQGMEEAVSVQMVLTVEVP